MEWKNIIRGFLMGISDLIPGVSGGTIAFILGIYNQLLESISGFFSREWKKHLLFLFPLGIGVVLALLLLSRLIEYLLEHHYEATQFFFVGLIVGVLPFIMKQAKKVGTFKPSDFFVAFISIVLVASMAFLKPENTIEPITSLTTLNVVLLFFSGWLASMAMLLPGISGSMVLLIIGMYPTAINALSTLNLPIIIIIGTGVILGFILSSKGITYLLLHYTKKTYVTIIGLIIGSIFVVFPGLVTGTFTIILCIITFTLGIGLALFLASINHNSKHLE